MDVRNLFDMEEGEGDDLYVFHTAPQAKMWLQ